MYEPSWLDIYMNALANQANIPLPLPSSNIQQPVPYVPPVDQTVNQNVQPMQQNSGISVDNMGVQPSQPQDQGMMNLNTLSSNGVM